MLRFNFFGKSGLLLLLILALFLAPYFHRNIASAQVQNEIKEATSSDSAKIEYDLAFPGILPDNPFYKLKVLRDKLSVFLISDPQKRVDYYLLQADKGILATAMLVDKNQIELAKETALKAENNMTLVTYELKRFSTKPEDKLFEKLKTASRKHQEVLRSLVERVSSEDQKTFVTVINFSKTNLQTIEKLQIKKYYNKQ